MKKNWFTIGALVALMLALTSTAYAQKPVAPGPTGAAGISAPQKAAPAQKAPDSKVADAPTPPAPLTEVETLRLQIAGAMAQVREEGNKRRKIEADFDELRLQVTLLQTTPERAGSLYDWTVGMFRDVKSGKVWRGTELVDAPAPAATGTVAQPKGGSQ